MMQTKMLRKKLGGLYILPAIVFLGFFVFFPLFYAVYCGMFQFKYMNQGPFLGLKNYIWCLTDKTILNSFKVTFIVTFWATISSVAFGLLISLWIDKKKGLFSYMIELIGLLPWVISMVVCGILWKWILNGELGLMGKMTSALGVKSIYLFNRGDTALVTMICIMAWRTVGYAMIMLLAGLKGIDGSLVEAAIIDGANEWQLLWKIKIPLIMTNFLLSLIVLTVSNFTNNTIPLVLTAGGPANATNVITLQQYMMSFEFYEFGRSSALSLLIMLATMVIIYFYMKVTKYEL